jgi:hypothetical protein
VSPSGILSRLKKVLQGLTGGAPAPGTAQPAPAPPAGAPPIDWAVNGEWQFGRLVPAPATVPTRRSSPVRRLPGTGAPLGSSPARLLAASQGVFYIATGLWPLVSLSSFVSVTGPKRDVWLLKTTGLLIAALGGVLLLGARRPSPSREAQMAGIGTAAALGSVDLLYVTKGALPRVYLLDALAEGAFLVAWGLLGRGAK